MMPFGEWLKASPMKRIQQSPHTSSRENENLQRSLFQNIGKVQQDKQPEKKKDTRKQNESTQVSDLLKSLEKVEVSDKESRKKKEVQTQKEDKSSGEQTKERILQTAELHITQTQTKSQSAEPKNPTYTTNLSLPTSKPWPTPYTSYSPTKPPTSAKISSAKNHYLQTTGVYPTSNHTTTTTKIPHEHELSRPARYRSFLHPNVETHQDDE